MTPTQIETSARNKYNAIGDSMFSTDEILDLMWEGCSDMARECENIEGLYSTSSVISQQSYALPTNAISIKRILYDGKKLMPINFRQDDAITGLNQTTLSTGAPQYYYIWQETFYLRPIPDSVKTLSIYTYNEPSVITAASTIEIPTQYHMALVNFITAEMAAKDMNFSAAQYYMDKWERAKIAAKRFEQKRKRGDAFSYVQNEENMVGSYLGMV